MLAAIAFTNLADKADLPECVLMPFLWINPADTFTLEIKKVPITGQRHGNLLENRFGHIKIAVVMEQHTPLSNRIMPKLNRKPAILFL